MLSRLGGFKVIEKYINGNTIVTIDLANGTKTRYTEDDIFKPEYAESMDVNITSKCDGLCPACYANCSPAGKHADLLSDYVMYTFIPSLKPYTELALNGNDLTHPQLCDFLVLLRTQNIVANLTVNQRHFMQHKDLLRDWTDDELIYGLGVSLDDASDQEFIASVQEFPNAVIHVIAGIFNNFDIEMLKNRGLKILVLGYKRKGRGVEWYEKNAADVESNIHHLSDILPKVVERGWFEVVSFDNLALEQLNVRSWLSDEQWDQFYMGDDGNFTFFVDLVQGKFARDSMIGEVYDIGGRDAMEMFRFIKERYGNEFNNRGSGNDN